MVAFRPATIGMVERVHRLAMPVGKSECASDRTRRAAQAASGIYGVVGRRGSTITTIGEPL